MRACLPAVFAAVVCVFPASIAAQSIFTVAGGGTDDGRPATVAGLDRPSSVAVDASGNLFIADRDHARIRKVDAATGIITTYAGNGASGFGGDGGPATLATLYNPESIALDQAGNLFIADRRNHRVRRVDAETGIIATVAGNGSGHSGDGGPATAAGIDAPHSVLVDASGNLYIVDVGSYRIRKVTKATGRISTIAGDGSWGSSGDGGPATLASFKLRGDSPSDYTVGIPPGLAVDTSGNLYISDPWDHRVRKISQSSGLVSAFAGTGTEAFSGDGGPAISATFSSPSGLALAPDGDLLIGDWRNDRIRRVDAVSGTISTVAGGGLPGLLGDGGPATLAYLARPAGVSLDTQGNIHASEMSGERVRLIDGHTGIIKTVAGTGRRTFIDEPGPAIAAGLKTPSGLARATTGDLYVSEWNAHRVRRVSATDGSIKTIAGSTPSSPRGDGGPATQADVPYPMGLVFDTAGNLYIASAFDNRIRKVDAASGTIVTIGGNGQQGFSGDGGPATNASINLSSDFPDSVTQGFPSGLAFDSAGNLHFADTWNHRIRKIAFPSGTVTTVAGNGLGGAAGDGGPATVASLNSPAGICFDSAGNLIIADTFNNRIMKIHTATGIITTIAGLGQAGFTGDGGPALECRFSKPVAVAFDSHGNLVVGDEFNYRVRRIDRTTSVIRTIAGSGAVGSSGDNGPATAASFSEPQAIAIAQNGDIYIADSGGDRIRVVPACVTVAPASLNSPATGSTGVSRAPRLVWDPVPGAFRYDVYLGTSNPPTTLAEGDVALNGYTAGNLAPITTYYWQIVAKGDSFCSSSSTSRSEIRSFTTTSSCALPGPFVTNP